MNDLTFYIDPTRCIGCRACVVACAECDTHRGYPMIHVDDIDRANGIETAPIVCMHCDDPTCAQVCPADAIKKNEDAIVQSALKPRCIACNNCVLACPFGIPKMQAPMELMMKCDMCYDRTSIGKKPMCATVCPSQALAFVSREAIAERRRDRPTNVFQFGHQPITTRVHMMVAASQPASLIDASDQQGEESDDAT